MSLSCSRDRLWQRVLAFCHFCLIPAFGVIVPRETYRAGQVSAVPNIEWLRLHEGGQNQHSTLPPPVTEPSELKLSMVPPYPGSRQGVSHWADHHGQLWLMGGWGFDGSSSQQPKFLNDLWVYDSARDKWKCLRDSKPPTTDAPDARHSGAACGLHATGFVVYGGSGENNKAFNDTWIYEINHAKWIKIIDSKENPEGRSDPVCWCVRDGLILFGGMDKEQRSLSDLWMFSFESLSWKKLEQKPAAIHKDGSDTMPTPRHGASTWVVGHDELYMFGGRNKNGGRNRNGYLSDMWLYSVRNNTWTLVHNTKDTKAETGTLGIAAADVSPRASAHHAAWVDAKSNLILFGGEAPTLLPDLWQFNTASQQWMWLGRQSLPVYQKSKENRNFPSARSHSMSWSFRNVMYLLGGYVLDQQNKSALSNEMFVLTKDNITYFFSTDDKWMHIMPASTVFIIILSTFTGVALTVGAGFFIKKTLEYPRHKVGEFDVRYSPLAQETTLEM